MGVNNVEKLREWFRECPAILKTNRFRADYLSDDSTEYAILSSPSTLITRENILGEMVLAENQSQNFLFASKEPYGADVEQNLQNLAFYQEVTSWIIEKNNKGEFPDWDGGHVRAIVPTLTAYPEQVGSDVAKYQIQLRVDYRIS